MKSNSLSFKKIAPYIFIPFIFAFIACVLFAIVLNPYISMASSAISLISADTPPDFSDEIGSIFSGIQEYGDQDSSQPEYVDIASVEIPDFGVHYGLLEIPSADISKDIYFGDSDNVLKKGLGQYIGSLLPGFNKPILIGGHNHTHFKNLKNVKIGDEVTITTNYGVYRYRVSETKIINVSDKKEYDLNLEEEKLMLYTCYPFNSYGLTQKRYFVFADKISGPIVK